MIKIESGVVKPITKGSRRQFFADTAKKMKPTDSVFFETKNQMLYFRAIVVDLGYKLESHKMDGGFRAWVIKNGGK